MQQILGVRAYKIVRCTTYHLQVWTSGRPCRRARSRLDSVFHARFEAFKFYERCVHTQRTFLEVHAQVIWTAGEPRSEYMYDAISRGARTVSALMSGQRHGEGIPTAV